MIQNVKNVVNEDPGMISTEREEETIIFQNHNAETLAIIKKKKKKNIQKKRCYILKNLS